jgi:hypothetical protein
VNRRPTRRTAPPPGLARHEAAARADARANALQQERDRLLREVKKKKLQLERVRERLSEEAATATARMAPLVRRHSALVTELARLFGELLVPGGAPPRAQKYLARLRRLLELRGVLAPRDDELEAPDAQTTPHESRGRARPATAPEVSGAGQVGQARRSLRELFRSLVKNLHPDQARHDAERERRTQVMKEVTRAYEDGDMARLLELESDWQAEQALSDRLDAETRCRVLEQANRELLDQVRRLTRELRDLKREGTEASFGLAPDALLSRAARELDELEEICRFVESFHDGKLSVSDLERGPVGLHAEVDELEGFAWLVSALLDDAPAPPPHERRRRRS